MYCIPSKAHMSPEDLYFSRGLYYIIKSKSVPFILLLTKYSTEQLVLVLRVNPNPDHVDQVSYHFILPFIDDLQKFELK